jgi:hypothetical protein
VNTLHPLSEGGERGNKRNKFKLRHDRQHPRISLRSCGLRSAEDRAAGIIGTVMDDADSLAVFPAQAGTHNHRLADTAYGSLPARGRRKRGRPVSRLSFFTCQTAVLHVSFIREDGGSVVRSTANAPPARLKARGPWRAGDASFLVPSKTRG